MKKIILVIAVIALTATAHAQELLSKKGTPILPEPKDWSIGFDASPLLKYVGNFFNHSDNNNTLMAYQDSLMIVGLYVKNANTAYRARVRLSFASQKWTAQVADQLSNSLTVNDERNYSQFGITLGLGMQKSRGKGRLRGNYGFEGLLGFFTSKNSYTYGNVIDENYHTPKSTNWVVDYPDPSNPSPANIDSSVGLVRKTAIDNGSVFGIGVRGFIGAEYFFAPKISLSAEYGWSILYQMNGAGEETSEQWDGLATTSTTAQTVKKFSFGSDIDNGGGMIVLHVYF